MLARSCFNPSAFDASGRNQFARELMAHMKINSYGSFLNNRQFATPDSGREAKLALIANYKFCLGFENSIAPDYVTEKFFDPLISGSVPVYRGAPNVDLFAPGVNSFIDASKFAGPRELAEFLVYLDNNDEAYRSYLAWREAGLSTGFEALLARHEVEPFCQLCRIVLRGKPYSPPSWIHVRFSAPDFPQITLSYVLSITGVTAWGLKMKACLTCCRRAASAWKSARWRRNTLENLCRQQES